MHGNLALIVGLMQSRFVAHIGPLADLPGENCCVFSLTSTEAARKKENA